MIFHKPGLVNHWCVDSHVHLAFPDGPMASEVGILKRATRRFMDDDCMTQAAALAYYATFSLAPVLLIVISVAGLVLGREAARRQVQEEIQTIVGSGAGTFVGDMIRNAGRSSSSGILGTVLGGLAVIFGATGALGQLQTALNRAWHVRPDPDAGGVRTFLLGRALSLAMILGIALLLLASVAVTASLSAFGDLVKAFLPGAFSSVVRHGMWFAASLAVVTVLFAAIFKVLPDAEVEWKDVWLGAFVTAVLFSIGRTLIGVYLGHTTTASSFGAAGSLVLILLWIYYSSLIFLFGAEFTAAWARSHGAAIRPGRGAVREEDVIRPRRAA